MHKYNSRPDPSNLHLLKISFNWPRGNVQLAWSIVILTAEEVQCVNVYAQASHFLIDTPIAA
ncbi:MAG: hypothetical protein ACI88A_004253 [Paraglaciecola sp.]|jgi:hypothetical protein